MALTFPGESADYRTARNNLLQCEIELRRATERAALARRELPQGGLVPEDYVFRSVDEFGNVIAQPMSDIFEAGIDTLAMYSYMFGEERDDPCPMCTPLLDGLNGVEDHLRQRVTVRVVAQSPPERLAVFAARRGWTRLKLISSLGNNYNRDYHGTTHDGDDTTMINIFHRDGGGVRHFWGSELAYGPEDPGQHHRGLDVINPVWQFFDLTPEGRGDWLTKVNYD